MYFGITVWKEHLLVKTLRGTVRTSCFCRAERNWNWVRRAVARQKSDSDSDVVPKSYQFPIYWVHNVTPWGNAIPPSYFDVIHEFDLVRQKYDVRITAVLESCSTRLLNLPVVCAAEIWKPLNVHGGVWKEVITRSNQASCCSSPTLFRWWVGVFPEKLILLLHSWHVSRSSAPIHRLLHDHMSLQWELFTAK